MSETKTASQRLAEITAQQEALKAEEKKLLAESKVADLATVRNLCKQHGFTATNLRGYLAVKGKKTTVAKTAKRPAAKKTAKAK